MVDAVVCFGLWAVGRRFGLELPVSREKPRSNPGLRGASLGLGYRHIDTGEAYGREESTGRPRLSGLKIDGEVVVD